MTAVMDLVQLAVFLIFAVASECKNYVVLNNGRQMPLVGFGTFHWSATAEQIKSSVYEAMKLGYRHFDCASLYRNERQVGQALALGMQNFNISRDELFITSKLWNTYHNPEDVEPAFRKSLKDLALDYLDLYLIHWPVAFEPGNIPFPHDQDGKIKLDNVHPTETWEAMEKLLDLPGNPVKSIGLANFNSRQIQDILDKAKVTPAVNQVECHVYLNQQNLRAFLASKNITMVAYSPMGNPKRPWAKKADPKVVEDTNLIEIGINYNKTGAQVALRYLIQQGIPVIPSSIKSSHIRENFDVMDFSLSDTEMAFINDLNGNVSRQRRFNNRKEIYAHSPYYPFHEEF